MSSPRYRVAETIDTVFFDLDDTLSDYGSTRDAAVREWVSGFTDWHLSPDQSARRWEELEVHWFARYTACELDLLGQRAQRVRDFLPGAADWPLDKAIDAFDELRAIYESNWRPFPDAEAALQRALASGRRVGILTNGETDYQTRKMRGLGLLDERLVMLASGDLPAAKPDLRAFQAACARMSTSPQRALMIGDNPVTDIAGGSAANLTVCQLCRDGAPPVTEIWVRSLDEIGF